MNYNEYLEAKKANELEIAHLQNELQTLQQSISTLTNEQYEKELNNINNYLTIEQQKLTDNNKIIDSYNAVIAAKEGLKKLESFQIKDSYDQRSFNEEFTRRNTEIADNIKNLPQELVDEINSNFIKGNDTSFQKVKETTENAEDLAMRAEDGGNQVLFDTMKKAVLDDKDNSTFIPSSPVINHDLSEEPNDLAMRAEDGGNQVLFDTMKKAVLDDKENPADMTKQDLEKKEGIKPIKVVGKKSWNWIKNNKKKIIAALGITTMTIAAIVGLDNLIPAIKASIQADNISTITNNMVNNSQLWNGAGSFQDGLHAANISLSEQFNHLTNATTAYNPLDGTWTLDGTNLSEYASMATQKATEAIAKVNSISHTMGAFIAGGSGLTIASMFLKNKSEAYKLLNNEIKELKKDVITRVINGTINSDISLLTDKISQTEGLSNEERQALFNKLKKLTEKSKHESDKLLIGNSEKEIVESAITGPFKGGR